MATIAEIANLRMLVAEPIPVSGTEDDTLFSDERIAEILTNAGGDPERAAYDAWREKAGLLANLVTVTEGAASREMTELRAKALEMIKLYSRSSAGPTEGRTRVGRIVRR